jgi:hypothetical protein
MAIDLLAVGEIGRLVILEGDGRKDDQRGATFAVVLLCQSVPNPRIQPLTKGWQTGLPAPGFVVPEEGENDVGLATSKPLVRCSEILGSKSDVDFVAGKAQMTENQVMISKSCVNQGFEPAKMLHPICQGIADDADVLIGEEVEGGSVANSRSEECGEEKQATHVFTSRGRKSGGLA